MVEMSEQRLVPLKMLKAADYNPRIMSPREMADLKRSLKEFGFIQPVVARKEDGLIIGGHQRLEAYRQLLKEQGNDELSINSSPVPVVYLEKLDDARTKLLNVALNKIHGEWDYEKLSSLFESLEGTADVELSGFNTEEVSDMLSLLGGAAPLLERSDALDEEVEAGLAAQARKFSFTVETDEEAAVCTAALRKMGMTGPGDAAEAFVKLAGLVKP